MSELARIAAAFVSARREDEVLSRYPGAHPESLEEAYRIQDLALSLWPDRVVGWKLGRIADGLVDRFGAQRLAGPIFKSRLVRNESGAMVDVPVLRGFAAVEAEIILRVSRPIHSALSFAEASAAIDEIRLGIEVASSPFSGINDEGPAVTASDFGNNYGLVLGPELSGFAPNELLTAPVELAVDGVQVGEGRASDMLDGPIGSLAFLTSVLEARGISLEAGSWISTGALTGVHTVTPGSVVTATLAGSHTVSCRTVTSGERPHDA
ncbi:2-keto-4-pentenoate hydratase [Tsuneonella dongtanensis]|uniref:2-keto-4-pentenoate hydratase n=1 Tax=Tsuneonella dongtanensis TaxID=692370 RepID=UPI001E335EF5|nr:fumarylacetoacetate hydrolase family protein [Tsuneonella dongtanensis]